MTSWLIHLNCLIIQLKVSPSLKTTSYTLGVLQQLHEVVHWYVIPSDLSLVWPPQSPKIVFQQSWGFPEVVSCCWQVCPTHPRPSQWGLGVVIVEARSCDTALHHSCLGSLSCWRNGFMILPLPCWLTMPSILRKSLSVTAKATPDHHLIPPCFTVETTHVEIIC